MGDEPLRDRPSRAALRRGVRRIIEIQRRRLAEQDRQEQEGKTRDSA